MDPNPVLKKLGFSPRDRVAIIHLDDIGMCQASVAAYADLFEFGLISSGAVRAPSPWFLAAAQFARAHPQADLGVHLTLNSEWETYRWGPVSTRDPAGKARHDRMVTLVESMLEMHKLQAAARAPADREIDALVCALRPKRVPGAKRRSPPGTPSRVLATAPRVLGGVGGSGAKTQRGSGIRADGGGDCGGGGYCQRMRSSAKRISG